MSEKVYSVWASHSSVVPVCADARRSSTSSSGQGGWDFGIRFTGLSDLVSNLDKGMSMPASYCGNYWYDCQVPFKSEKSSGVLERLAINSHGIEGELQINGTSTPGITADNVSTYGADLKAIGDYLVVGGSVFLMGCLAGRGKAGTELLVALSRIWGGCRVIGFSTIGYRSSGGMKATGDSCFAPGMRDTDETSSWSESQMDKRFKSMWYDMTKLPWASSTSPHAKIAKNGAITKWPDGEAADGYKPEPDTLPVVSVQRTYAPPAKGKKK